MADAPDKRVTIYTRSMLDRARELGVDIVRHLAVLRESFADHVLTFPDGALQVGIAAFDYCWQAIAQPVIKCEMQELERELRFAITAFNGLTAFGGEAYNLYCYGDWLQQTEGERIWIYTASPQFQRQEYPLDKVEVRVIFARTPTKQTSTAFAQHVAAWAASVRVQGIQDDGPVSLVSDSLEITGSLARFCLDFSRSGQQTVNWLIVALAAFCETAAIENIFFVDRPGPHSTFETLFSKHQTKSYVFPSVAISDKSSGDPAQQ